MSRNRLLVNRDHTHQLIVCTGNDGWDIREEEDATVLMRVHRDDWHRVERDILLFDTRAEILRRAGWIEL